MEKREKILAAVTGGLLLTLGGNYVYGRLQTAYDQRIGRIESLTSEIQNKDFAIQKGVRAQKQLKTWKDSSLPSDPQEATRLYQNYVMSLLDETGMDRVDVGSTKPANRGGVYHLLSFNIRAQSTLEQLTRFMYAFYQAGHLHQIANLSAKPIEGGKLDINLKIEALSLVKADRKDKLSDHPSDRLAWSDLEDYQAAIGHRNLFANYVAPPPPPRPVSPRPAPPAPPAFDAAKFAVVSAIIDFDEQPQVWVNVRTSGELLKRHVGDSVEVGLFKGKITRIESQSVEIESDGKRKVVALGQSLR